jgi:sepiapterin reductase
MLQHGPLSTFLPWPRNFLILIFSIEPFDCWSVYCSVKAARDMFHQCIATENNVRVLNYAPGPLDTDMQKEIRDNMPNVPLKAVYTQMHQDKKLVSPHESAQKLLSLIIQDTFKNGAHLDYYE